MRLLATVCFVATLVAHSTSHPSVTVPFIAWSGQKYFGEGFTENPQFVKSDVAADVVSSLANNLPHRLLSRSFGDKERDTAVAVMFLDDQLDTATFSQQVGAFTVKGSPSRKLSAIKNQVVSAVSAVSLPYVEPVPWMEASPKLARDVIFLSDRLSSEDTGVATSPLHSDISEVLAKKPSLIVVDLGSAANDASGFVEELMTKIDKSTGGKYIGVFTTQTTSADSSSGRRLNARAMQGSSNTTTSSTVAINLNPVRRAYLSLERGGGMKGGNEGREVKECFHFFDSMM